MIQKLQQVLLVLLAMSVLEGFSAGTISEYRMFCCSKLFCTETCNEYYDAGSIRLKIINRAIHGGVIQICNRYWSYEVNDWIYSWEYVTTAGWTDIAAQVVCRQLGLPHSGECWHNY